MYSCTLTVHSADVLHGDLAVAPDGGDHEVQLLAAQALERGAQVLTVHHESQHSLIHIENSWKRWHSIMSEPRN